MPAIELWQHGVALGLVAADIAARGGRSAVLLPVSFARAMVVNCCGDVLASITPARIGGDPLRFVGFTRTGAPGPAVLASFVTETVLNTVVLGAGAGFLIAFYAQSRWALARGFAERARAGPNLSITFAVLALCALAVFAVIRRAPRLWERLAAFFSASWRSFRTQSRGTLAWAGLYTVLSMIARFAILPVLVAQTPGIGAGALILGSVAALYALLLMPTPGSLGIEAGFVAGFGATMNAGEVAALIVAWRAYTWLAGVVLGALLLWRERIQRRTER